MPVCAECGCTVAEGNIFCTECGKPLEKKERPSPQPEAEKPAAEQTTAAVIPTPVAPSIPTPAAVVQNVMSVGGYLGMLVLFLVPVVGIVFCIVWACGASADRNRVNFSRAYLIYIAVFIVALALLLLFVFSVLAIIFGIYGGSLWETLGGYGTVGEFIDSLIYR